MSVRPFRVQVSVTDELPREGTGVHEAVRDALLAKVADLRGPRGGRYVMVGEPDFFEDGVGPDDFLRNTRTFSARVLARYVRPKAR